MSLKPKVALAQEFLAGLAKLPSATQGKVLKWAIRFQSDPTASGINYEKVQAARDPNLKSIRIDQDWRGIVFKPAQGDVYVLLYVGHHDDAYRWAERRKLAINPITGAMQVVVLEEVRVPDSAPATVPDARIAIASRPLFAACSDRELVSLGTPEELVPRVRMVHSEDELDRLQPDLPVEAYEGLFLVAAGDSVDQILEARETRVDRAVDTGDFAASLETPESRSRFVIVDDDDALAAILNAPLAQWRVFLHPTQHRLAVGDRSGPVRVLGGAGTGKTVLAMHRAKWLAENRTPEGRKVLFTTFTRNLAIDIEENLRTLCSAATLQKIEVRNLDAWVHAFLRAHRYEHTIVYDRQREAAEPWQRALAVKDPALGLPDDFYEKELEQVILAQGITTGDDYRGARRAGRGVLLSRAKRDLIWPVFEEYRAQLASRKLKEVDDAYRDASAMLDHAEKAPAYSAIVVDETQDFGPQALRLLRAMVPRERNDLFFVGDGHQRIYRRNRAAMSRCGIDIRGRSRKLYLNYRTTEEIRRQAAALLEGCEVDDLDDGQDEGGRYKSLSHGAAPVVVTERGFEEALDRAHGLLREWDRPTDGAPSRSACVIAPRRRDRDAAASYFKERGTPVRVIDADERDDPSRPALRLATMHRAKGLEFDQVVVLGPSDMLGPLETTGDARKLLYVALTRAKGRAALILY
jgi:superfamily I DNA/RNA helicase